MKILVLGAGKMGAWLIRELSKYHPVAAYDADFTKLEGLPPGVEKLAALAEVRKVQPAMVINAVNLEQTTAAFEQVLPYIDTNCLLADITSVKAEVARFYQRVARRFVSTHPMFGPTFANLDELGNENAIIITESDDAGKVFFREFYQRLRLNIFDYSFEEHDRVTAYSLGIPFSASLTFAASLKAWNVPGTTFKKHLEIVKGLLAEDNFLLAEILFNPHTLGQIEHITSRLAYLTHIIRQRDYEEMQNFLNNLRRNLSAFLSQHAAITNRENFH